VSAGPVVAESAGDRKFSIDFHANPTQGRFIRDRHEATLWSSRMGAGKSAGLVWASFHHTKENPGARTAIVRDTYEVLRDTTMKEFFKWFPPGICGEYHVAKKTFTWRLGEIQGEVCFLGMDDPADAGKLQSRELAAVFFDELAPAVNAGGIDEYIFDVALSRLRQPGMHWYAAKAVSNNPDESHWSYRRFVDPGDRGTDPAAGILPLQLRGFQVMQEDEDENVHNLPPGYYARLRKSFSHRPDLVRRFVDGKFGFQQIGRPVCPEWSDDLHLGRDLLPVKGEPLWVTWDGGQTPTCVITQFSPMGHWNIFESYVGERIGMYELVESVVKPVMQDRYSAFELIHTGDPNLESPDQSSSKQNAVKVIRRALGGRWKRAPDQIHERVDPLRWALTQNRNGTGLVRVDKKMARHVWHALRGGWHYNTPRTGTQAQTPLKNMHSHPGDATGYAAAVLFPQGQVQRKKTQRKGYGGITHFGRAGLGIERPDLKPPKQGEPAEKDGFEKLIEKIETGKARHGWRP
jgi:hypothetical protein